MTPIQGGAEMIAMHTTGHTWAPDGTLLRADFISGQWVASRYNERLFITAQFVGTDEMVHEQIIRWSSRTTPPPKPHKANPHRKARNAVTAAHPRPGRPLGEG
jgi:hypothetical protein